MARVWTMPCGYTNSFIGAAQAQCCLQKVLSRAEELPIEPSSGRSWCHGCLATRIGYNGVEFCRYGVSYPDAFAFSQRQHPLNREWIVSTGIKKDDAAQTRSEWRVDPPVRLRVLPAVCQSLRRQFEYLLEHAGLRQDRLGRDRTLYSLRHSALMYRLLHGENVDIFIVKNALTSVDQLERFYLSHAASRDKIETLYSFAKRVL